MGKCWYWWFQVNESRLLSIIFSESLDKNSKLFEAEKCLVEGGVIFDATFQVQGKSGCSLVIVLNVLELHASWMAFWLSRKDVQCSFWFCFYLGYMEFHPRVYLLQIEIKWLIFPSRLIWSLIVFSSINDRKAAISLFSTDTFSFKEVNLLS